MKSSPLFLVAAAGAATAFAPHGRTESTRAQRTSLAFFGGGAKTAPKSSPLAGEAVEIYTSKYRGKSPRKLFFDSWGVPERARRSKGKNTPLIFERTDGDLAATFNEIASLYGEENALKMVKIQPNVLAFNRDFMRPSLDAFGENFGVEESKAMIIRNPGLLSVKPQAAAASDGLTMQLSYVVDFTRPIGVFGPIILVALLSVPAIESVTGVSRAEFFSSLF